MKLYDATCALMVLLFMGFLGFAIYAGILGILGREGCDFFLIVAICFGFPAVILLLVVTLNPRYNPNSSPTEKI